MSTSDTSDAKLEIELRRIVSIPEASKLSNLSEDTIRRHHADKIVRLSPRRVGMAVRDALAIGSKN